MSIIIYERVYTIQEICNGAHVIFVIEATMNKVIELIKIFISMCI
jgi:hypothetical protein